MQGQYPIYEAAVSPDGRWLAYQSTESNRAEVYVTHFPSLQGKWQVSDGGRQMIWRRDSKALYYSTPEGYVVEVPLRVRGQDLEVSPARQLFKFKQAQFNPFITHSFVVSPDGRFIITQPEEEFSKLNLMINWPAALKK